MAKVSKRMKAIKEKGDRNKTRPREDASQLTADLVARGHQVTVEPLLTIEPVAGAAIAGWNWVAPMIMLCVAAVVGFVSFGLYTRRVLRGAGCAVGPFVVMIRNGRAWATGDPDDRGDVFLVIGDGHSELVDETDRVSYPVDISSGWKFGVSRSERLRSIEFLGRTVPAREMRWVHLLLLR